MIKIRAGFIQDIRGAWHNIRMIRSLFVGGYEDVGFRICFSYETYYDPKMNFEHKSIGETYKTHDEAQVQLDGIFELLEYEKSED